ncbi:MAG: phytanoyl-CoA dioxygenase family protein [Alphaproteobacteria bacterium]
MIWAIDEFTTENGATQLIHGSHTWGDEMPAGVPDEREIATPRNGPAYQKPVI